MFNIKKVETNDGPYMFKEHSLIKGKEESKSSVSDEKSVSPYLPVETPYRLLFQSSAFVGGLGEDNTSPITSKRPGIKITTLINQKQEEPSIEIISKDLLSNQYSHENLID